MMHRFVLAAVASVGFLTMAEAEPQTVPLGANPTLGGGKFSIGGGITVAVEPRQTVDGRMALCGVWAESERLSAYVRRYTRDVLAPGTLAVNGQVVRHDLRAFNQVKPADSYAGAEANCVGTDLPYRAGADVEVRIPRTRVVNERDGGDPSIEVWFLPSDEANPALGSGSILPVKWTRFLSPGNK